MKTVNIQRTKLLETLKENRRKHIETYELAMSRYYVAIENELKALLKKTKEKNLKRPEIKTVVPVSYVAEYDFEISKLEWCVDEFIEVDSTYFKQIVNDEWGWANAFKLITSSYIPE